MFVRVDDNSNVEVEGFSYLTKTGLEEKVKLTSDYYVTIWESAERRTIDIYTEDIPKLIKALQAAYDHIQKGK